MTQVYTPEGWVEDISSQLVNSQDMNELLVNMAMIVHFKRFQGVVPHCINVARWKAAQLGHEPGLTVVVDGESVMCSIGFATDDIDKLPEKAVESIRKIERDMSPKHLIVAFDSESNYRKEMLQGYKGDRRCSNGKKEIDERRTNVISTVREHFQVEICDKREADDVLATVATQCQVLGVECVMVTEDKDCWQALGPNTSIYSRKKKSYIGTQWLMATHRIGPKQVVDWLCMIGKNGIEGVPGVGAATASDLLSAHGTFIDAQDAKSTPEKIRQAMKGFDYWRARTLHTLDRRLPIGRASY